MREKNQEKRRYRRINVDLDGIIRFYQTDYTIECVIHNVSEDCMGFMIVTHDPRVCKREDLNLSVIIPAERSPIKCAGKITWHSANEEPFRSGKIYAAGIFTTDISRIDRRRLDLAIDRKRLFNSGGYSSRYAF